MTTSARRCLVAPQDTAAEHHLKACRVNHTQAVVDFKVNHSVYTVEGRAMGYPRWKIGQVVEVYYSEKDPGMARIKRWDEIYFCTLISSFF